MRSIFFTFLYKNTEERKIKRTSSIGLTATPSKQTLGFFNQNLVMEYSHERAVADGVNVGYDVYRIETEMTKKGGKVDAGFFIDKRDKLTRKVRWEVLDDDLAYEGSQLDRDVVAVDQIRTVIKTFRDKLFTEIFPGREDVPKTLIFAKDDSHADLISFRFSWKRVILGVSSGIWLRVYQK